MSSDARGVWRRPVLAWACYDWANSAFATTVMAGFFPLFFKQYSSAGADVTVSTFRLGMANTTAGIVIALLAPILGAIADRGGSRKAFLLVFALFGAGMTASLSTLAQGDWQSAALLYVAATVGFLGANVFYDSLIVDVSSPAHYDSVSARGFAFGYLGGGLLFALNVAMVREPELFGLADAGAAVRLSFLLVAAWWALFTMPLLVWVRERPAAATERRLQAVVAGWRQLLATAREVGRLRNVALFLCAYWLYIDGVDTVITMAVDYGLSLGLPQGALISALLITQFVGFPAALAFGLLGERYGTRGGILLGIGVYVVITIWATQVTQARDFYLLAVAVGLVQGGVQSLSRSFYARLIPPDKSGEFFGFYNMMGKFATVLGPALVGWTALLTGSSRAGILSIAVLFMAGGFLLLRVQQPAPAASSR